MTGTCFLLLTHTQLPTVQVDATQRGGTTRGQVVHIAAQLDEEVVGQAEVGENDGRRLEEYRFELEFVEDAHFLLRETSTCALSQARKQTKNLETEKLHVRKVLEGADQRRHARRTDIVAVENDRMETRHHGRGEVELEDVHERPTLRKHLGEKLRTLVAHMHV